MLTAIEALRSFADDRDRSDYAADLLFRSAVERQLEILGEAMRRLEKLDASLVKKISDYREIINLRNVIAHGYDEIDDDIIWQIVTASLNGVERDARTLLQAFDSP